MANYKFQMMVIEKAHKRALDHFDRAGTKLTNAEYDVAMVRAISGLPVIDHTLITDLEADGYIVDTKETGWELTAKGEKRLEKVIKKHLKL